MREIIRRKPLSETTRKKISESNKGKIVWNKGLRTSEEQKKILSELSKKFYSNPDARKLVSERTKLAMQRPEVRAKLGRPCSEITKAKMSLLKKEQWNNPEYRKKTTDSHKGKKLSQETRAKMRQTALSRVLKNGTMISVGKNEKQILDTCELDTGYKIQRGYNIKKLGFVVDGYCPETNTVYEIYEPFHNRQVFEDLQREEAICRQLSCDFVILYDKDGSK
jgi:very-short-patch-repair endonuclease